MNKTLIKKLKALRKFIVIRCFLRWRKHKYDLQEPIRVDTGVETRGADGIMRPIRYTKFKCKECGRELALDLWQMHDLPNEMKYGCGGKNSV